MKYRPMWCDVSSETEGEKITQKNQWQQEETTL